MERLTLRKGALLESNTRTYEAPRYQPVDPSCQPYWDLFYENPYPSAKEWKGLADWVNMRPETLRVWFMKARQFTHAPERGPENEADAIDCAANEDMESDRSDSEESPAKGTLYAHFYQSVVSEKTRPMKRTRSGTVTKGDGGPQVDDPDRKRGKVTHHRGQRGPYTGKSETTARRNRKHAQKYASDIRTFFSPVNRLPANQTSEYPSSPVNEESAGDSESEPERMCHSDDTPSSGVTGYDLAPVLEGEGAPAASVDAMGSTEIAGITNDGMSLATYLSALELLEVSMDRLKLDIRGDDATQDPRSNDQSRSQNCTEPNIHQTNYVTQPGPEPANAASVTQREEGPKPQDAEDEIAEVVDLLDDLEEDSADEPYDVALNRHLNRLLSIEKKAKTANAKRLIELTVLSDYNNLRKAYLDAKHKSPSITASNRIAEAKFVPTTKKPVYRHESWYARHLRAKANHLVRFGYLPESKQGKGGTHYSLLAEEDVRRGILSYLRTLKTGRISPTRLRREVNQKILPELGIMSPICESTARRWLIRLGYRPIKHSKGMYIDGHERSDVAEYQGTFLDSIKAIQPFIQQYDDKTDQPIPLVLSPGAKRHIPVAHDESCFHANDRDSLIWVREGEQELRQKGRGRIIHVSDFVTEEHGRLALTPEMLEANQNLPIEKKLNITDARKIIEPGKNYNKWWDMDQLCEQLSDTLKIFDRMYPNCVGVFFFDQSSAHNAFADDALVAKRMKVGPGGKNDKPMHDTVIPMNNPNPALRGKPQSMVYPPGHTHAGKSKGMREILQERELLDSLERGPRGRPVGVCGFCQQSEEARSKAEKAAQEQMDADPTFYRSFEDTGLDDEPTVQSQTRSSTCCMQRCLSLQDDFVNEKPRIQLMIEKAGHRCIFLPKFHCELNPIEMYWGYAKRLFRAKSDGTVTTARKLVPECLDAATVQTIRHFWRKSWRYMDAYMHGLTGKQAEFAVKKFKSHRRIGTSVMADIMDTPN